MQPNNGPPPLVDLEGLNMRIERNSSNSSGINLRRRPTANWLVRGFRRMDFTCAIPSYVVKQVITHLGAFIRCYVMFVLI